MTKFQGENVFVFLQRYQIVHSKIANLNRRPRKIGHLARQQAMDGESWASDRT